MLISSEIRNWREMKRRKIRLDLSSLTRNQTCVSALAVQSLNHGTAREVPCLAPGLGSRLRYHGETHQEGRNHGQVRDPLWCLPQENGEEN